MAISMSGGVCGATACKKSRAAFVLPHVTKIISCFQSKLREVERKINLENAQYEELMLELSLKKKEVTKTNGFAPKDQQEFVDTSRKGRWR